MPLIHSPSEEAFHENVRREVEAGKPQRQAVAAAYSARRGADADGSALRDCSPGFRDMIRDMERLAPGDRASVYDASRDSYDVVENRGAGKTLSRHKTEFEAGAAMREHIRSGAKDPRVIAVNERE